MSFAESIISDAALGWLRLSMIRGIGPVLGRRLVQAIGGIDALWQATAAELAAIDGIGGRLQQLILHARSDAAETIAVECRQHGVHLLCPDDQLWPERLLAVEDAPLILFVRGDPSRLDLPHMLAMVGARRASRQGRMLSRRWARYFCEHEICIVSGMAYGIDAEAHGGALEAGGPTVAVLGSGLLALNELQLRQVEAIIKCGCVVSEFLPAQQARPDHFPRRNRIIAALSDATVVMEAEPDSGSLITARLAGEYGRELFAVPGPVLAGTHAGCHHLIRDGAILADSAETLLTDMGWLNGRGHLSKRASSHVPASVEEAKILSAIGPDAVHIDLICETCGLTLPQLSPILLALELQGVVERLPGSRYQLMTS